MAAKKELPKTWYCIEYDCKGYALVAYFKCTWKDFQKHLKKYESKYERVSWWYCDNPYK